MNKDLEDRLIKKRMSVNDFIDGELAFLYGEECPADARQDFKRGWETEKMRFEYSQDQSFINKCEKVVAQ